MEDVRRKGEEEGEVRGQNAASNQKPRSAKVWQLYANGFRNHAEERFLRTVNSLCFLFLRACSVMQGRGRQVERRMETKEGSYRKGL